MPHSCPRLRRRPGPLAEIEKLLSEVDETQTIFDKRLPTVRAGELLGGRFRILRFVGKGEWAKSTRPRTATSTAPWRSRSCAPNCPATLNFLQRFRREVQVARQVTHANVCRVYDVGYDRQGDRQRVFLTMEFLDGETLEEHLRRAGRLDTATALPLIEQMAAGLGRCMSRASYTAIFKPGTCCWCDR